MNTNTINTETIIRKHKINSDDYTLADFIEYRDKNIFSKANLCFEFCQDWKNKGTYQYMRSLTSACQNRVMMFDEKSGIQREMIMMASNNYLGLSTHPKIISAAEKALKKYGTGVSSAPMLSGTLDITKKLEKKLAQFKGCEDAILFTTGYSANVGAISALVREGDAVIIDRLDHASIIDGCRLSDGNIRTFKHNDMDSLKKQLEICDREFNGKLIVIDGVYSMDGDIARLPEILELARRYNAKVMVDDAHASGVIGKHGGGTSDYFNLNNKVDLIMGTFSKTFAATGGFVASTKEVVNYLRCYARSYMFSAAPAPSVIATVLAGLKTLEEEPELRKKLWKNIYYMHNNLQSLGYRISPSPPESAIISVQIGSEVTLRKMSKKIHELGIYANAIPFPAVPKNQSRFRLSLMATHTLDDLDIALDVFDKTGREYGII
ncbi:aminotransferase class I/II-fold pyridoxal phosphate-dependent enzyme [Candidatus Desantisbacteria bacterium]|nr:aminotransferase class I/II-fold pyridoxal phosphate-dependent enzyme [Candidatus Desantisbacteria bacterium]